MREIEFRAWLKKEKKMVDVVSINFNDKVIAYNDNEKQELCINCSFEDVELMQYTGLKDKNGVEIYEGDIVKSIYGEIYDVFFASGGFMLSDLSNFENEFNLTDSHSAKLEVIGNIYENPELLGE